MTTETTETEVAEEIPAWKKMGDQFNDLMTPKDEEPKPSEKPAEAAKPAPAVVSDKPKSEEAAKVEKPVEVAPVLNDAPPGNVVGKAADSWNAFKSKSNKEIADRDGKIATLEKDLETAKKTVVTQPIDVTKAPEFEALKKRLEDSENQLKVVAIERNAQFREVFGKKIKEATEMVKQAVGAELAPRVEKILKINDYETRREQIKLLQSDMDTYDISAMSSALFELQKVERERDAELETNRAANSFEILQAREREAHEKNTAQQKATIAKQKSDALVLARKTMDAFKTKDGDDAHNAGVKQNEEFIENFFDGTIDPKLFAAVPALAAESMFLRQTKIPELEAALKKRDEIIASYQSSKPNLDGGGAGGGEGKSDPNKSPEQNFAAGYAKIMAGG